MELEESALTIDRIKAEKKGVRADKDKQPERGNKVDDQAEKENGGEILVHRQKYKIRHRGRECCKV